MIPAAVMRAVRHRESGRLIATRCRVAGTCWARLRGWVSHRPGPGEGLWLHDCRTIHTMGVPVAIDAVFCGREGLVRRVVASLRSCRLARAAGATQVCELPEGGAAGILPGDHLDLV